MNWKHKKAWVKVKAPSNIAWIKYWGKKGLQLPMNPSLSLTLDVCNTVTEMALQVADGPKAAKPVFYFHGERNDKFLPKIETFIQRVSELYPFTRNLESIEIKSENSFPHSSGIASSASAFAALALAFEEVQSGLEQKEKDLVRASKAARLGSGSACRSLYGLVNLWGSCAGLGSDEYSTAVEGVHPVFAKAKNAIAVVSGKEKSVGSTAGHSLMDRHPFGEARIAQANKNCLDALSCVREGNIWALGNIIENEAMTLHALMMTSDPSFILMAPNTLKAIDIIRKFRESEKVPVFFTLDAGPNPHILYFEDDANKVEKELLESLRPLCEGGRIILDQAGEGAKVLESRFE